MLVGTLVLAIVATACGSDDASGPATSASATTAVIGVTTSTVGTTTTSSTSTSTSTSAPSTTTSTTTPPGVQLVLSETGLGTAAFGAEADGVVSYVDSIIGAPTTDTGWVDPATFGACPGTELRIVTWNDLSLYFSDESIVATGRRHFMSYIYGPAFAAEINPLGLRTSNGIGVGSTVAELRGAFPTAVVNPGDELAGPSFFIVDGLFGYLSGISDADVVTEFVGGFGCGE